MAALGGCSCSAPVPEVLGVGRAIARRTPTLRFCESIKLPSSSSSSSSSLSFRRGRKTAISAFDDPDVYQIPYVEGIPVGKKLKLWNLPPNCPREDLLEWFHAVNVTVTSLEFTHDPVLNAQGIGGFVEFATKRDACVAIIRLDGYKLKGFSIRMDFVEKRPYYKDYGSRRSRKQSGNTSGTRSPDDKPAGNSRASQPDVIDVIGTNNRSQHMATGESIYASNFMDGSGYVGSQPGSMHAMPSESYPATTDVAVPPSYVIGANKHSQHLATDQSIYASNFMDGSGYVGSQPGSVQQAMLSESYPATTDVTLPPSYGIGANNHSQHLAIDQSIYASSFIDGSGYVGSQPGSMCAMPSESYPATTDVTLPPSYGIGANNHSQHLAIDQSIYASNFIDGSGYVGSQPGSMRAMPSESYSATTDVAVPPSYGIGGKSHSPHLASDQSIYASSFMDGSGYVGSQPGSMQAMPMESYPATTNVAVPPSYWIGANNSQHLATDQSMYGSSFMDGSGCVGSRPGSMRATPSESYPATTDVAVPPRYGIGTNNHLQHLATDQSLYASSVIDGSGYVGSQPRSMCAMPSESYPALTDVTVPPSYAGDTPRGSDHENPQAAAVDGIQSDFGRFPQVP